MRIDKEGSPLVNLFSVKGTQWHEDLDNTKIPDGLRQRFNDENVPLSDNASVSVAWSGSQWRITDGQQAYHIQKEEDAILAFRGEPNAPIVVLQNKDDKNQLLPIWIGHFEALAIIMRMENKPSPRPMTHDLMINIIREFNMKILRIVVTDLKEDTFYARITIESDGSLKEIDARPSDAIALALRANAPIFVAKSILSSSGVDIDKIPKI